MGVHEGREGGGKERKREGKKDGRKEGKEKKGKEGRDKRREESFCLVYVKSFHITVSYMANRKIKMTSQTFIQRLFRFYFPFLKDFLNQ